MVFRGNQHAQKLVIHIYGRIYTYTYIYICISTHLPMHTSGDFTASTTPILPTALKHEHWSMRELVELGSAVKGEITELNAESPREVARTNYRSYALCTTAIQTWEDDHRCSEAHQESDMW